jgi:hypothetical protein
MRAAALSLLAHYVRQCIFLLGMHMYIYISEFSLK